MAKATFLGTYSTRGVPGGMPAPTEPKIFWFVWEDSIARSFLIQQLDKSFDPADEPRLLSPKMFRPYFTREPKITLIPAIAPDVADYLDRVFTPETKEEGFTYGRKARPSATPVPDLDPSPAQLDKELRAEFAKAIMKLRKGDREGASEAFRQIAERREGIIRTHKHMFTDFGKDLRKSKLYDLALAHFARAAELSPEDSHACFNMARICYEMGDLPNALEFVNRALQLDPSLRYAQILKDKVVSALSKDDGLGLLSL